ncbi:PREDICTED: uncharacterized protein LOC104717565 [Camelina sativa]|uniref:Uncharacterized protein LOC104717565 n=1 Tax=Camelina sativa TaxID=90675 RepID=A0ABM0TZ05_CAMSA|nr:PREDICTED: uncharacterized protein LOC104717565 [Camelina sativa]
MDTSSHMSCVLKINMQTRGWEKSMHKLIRDIPDVTYMIDAAMGLAYVSGKINPEIILKIRKCKKHVQLIQIDYGHNLTPRSSSYYLPTTTGYNQPQPPTPMSQAPAQPYMHYLQIPYEQPQVAYPYFNPYL